jgi:citrate lyase subunit beta / citryl-CoA lyase
MNATIHAYMSPNTFPTVPYSTLLFVPGDQPKRFDKAVAAGADAVVIDLEDAVSPANKTMARLALTEWLGVKLSGSTSQPSHPQAALPHAIFIRINSVASSEFSADLSCVMACLKLQALSSFKSEFVFGVMLAKTQQAQDIELVQAAVPASLQSALRPILPTIALIESAVGLHHALSIARSAGVHQLAFGSIDYAVDLGLSGDADLGEGLALAHARSSLVLASRLAGIAAPIDGVTPAIDQPTLLEAETLRARRFGFAGKLCIHPKQIEVVRRCFLPDEKAVTWARSVLAAVTAAGASGASTAALQVDGKMVDKPVIVLAQRIIDRISDQVSPRAAP